MIYCLLSSISLEAISIALFLVLALGVLFFVCISRNSKATEFVQVNKQRTGRSKRVLSILFAILSLSLILGSSIVISNQSTSQDASSMPTYKISKDVNADYSTLAYEIDSGGSSGGSSSSGSSNQEALKTRTISLNKIRNAATNQIFSIEGKSIRDVEFVFSRKSGNNYPYGQYGSLRFWFAYEQDTEPITKIIYKHEEKNDPDIYYYITISNSAATEKDEEYVIQEYSNTWVDDQWFEVFKSFLDDNLAAIIITLLVAAAFWAIILGINMAKAPDSATAGKFKTRLWQLFIGLFILIAAIFFLYWILGNISGIIEGDAIQDLRDGFNSSSFRSFLNKIK